MKQFISLSALILFSISTFGQKTKMNFQEVDNNFIITKIAMTKPGTYSFTKNNDLRYYGLTNEELYKAFGNDRVGKIGNKNNFIQNHLSGLNYTAINALCKWSIETQNTLQDFEKRFDLVEKENMRLMDTFQETQNISEKINQMQELEQIVKEMEVRITELEQLIEQMKNN
eukprot:Anaeramoba_ignava/a225689_20.p1 GENE.a225689_20~~a225689_20.p1  ORF type:complete len:171 (+),score=25.00 a225689_20:103-615(+)